MSCKVELRMQVEHLSLLSEECWPFSSTLQLCQFRRDGRCCPILKWREEITFCSFTVFIFQTRLLEFNSSWFEIEVTSIPSMTSKSVWSPTSTVFLCRADSTAVVTIRTSASPLAWYIWQFTWFIFCRNRLSIFMNHCLFLEVARKSFFFRTL